MGSFRQNRAGRISLLPWDLGAADRPSPRTRKQMVPLEHPVEIGGSEFVACDRQALNAPAATVMPSKVSSLKKFHLCEVVTVCDEFWLLVLGASRVDL